MMSKRNDNTMKDIFCEFLEDILVNGKFFANLSTYSKNSFCFSQNIKAQLKLKINNV